MDAFQIIPLYLNTSSTYSTDGIPRFGGVIDGIAPGVDQNYLMDFNATQTVIWQEGCG